MIVSQELHIDADSKNAPDIQLAQHRETSRVYHAEKT